MTRALRHLEAELRALAETGLLRRPPDAVPPGALVLCSNDYLGYGRRPLREGEAPGGARASRLVCGDHPAHHEAERALADWFRAPAALLFTSGYAANVGTISALAGPGDVVISDALNHASLIDGCRLSGAAVVVVPHLDTNAVERALAKASEARRRWVVTESYFSMDGDEPALPVLRALCDAHDAALVLDEAHAVGVFGPEGRGLAAEAGVVPDVLIGTLGKSLGLQGAFVVGAEPLRAWLWNRARSFVFSTGLSPALAGALVERIEEARADDAARLRLDAHGALLRERLAEQGIRIGSARGPVLPWVIGSSVRAVEVAARARGEGVIVQAIRPPTVPAGTARLRITVQADLAREDIVRAADALGRASRFKEAGENG